MQDLTPAREAMMGRYGHLFKSEDHKRAMDEIARKLFE